MTEAEAWREIARRWAENDHNPLWDDMGPGGLCISFGDLRDEQVIDDDVGDRMSQRVKRFSPNDDFWQQNGAIGECVLVDGTVYFWQQNGAIGERVLAACFLAAMAEDDA